MNRSAIDTLHGRLLELHKVLLDGTQVEYEREHGKIPNPGAFLQLVINHEQFAWLRPLSGLLVDIDDPETTPDGQVARRKVEKLFADNPRYLESVKASPLYEQTTAALSALPSHVTA